MAASYRYPDAAVLPGPARIVPASRRAGTLRPTTGRAVVVVVAGLAAGVASAFVAARSPVIRAPHTAALVRGVVPVLYTTVGAALWLRRPATRVGMVLAAVGLTYALTTPTVSADPTWHSLGRIASAAWLAVFAYAFLSYPLGHLTSTAERLVVGGYVAVSGVLWLCVALSAKALPAGGALTACKGPCPGNGLQVVDARAGVAHVLERGLQAVTILMLAGMLVLLGRRALSHVVVVRLTIVPTLVAASLLSASYVAYSLHPEGDEWWAAWAAVAAAGAIACPLGFVVGPVVTELFVSRRFVRGVAGLAPTAMSTADIERICRSALGDDSARLATIGGGGNGAPHVLLVDRALARGYDRVVWMVERLAVTLEESAQLLRGVRSSRRRIAEHESHERARLERDLHDGTQQRLLALQLKLAALAEDLQGSPLAPEVEAIVLEAAAASAEVRTISHGIYPSLLVERGLADTIRSLPASPTVPIEVRAEELPRLHPSTERAVYFAVAEAVQNATKHANATSIEVGLTCRAGLLEVVVADDGDGFDPDDFEASPGLVGLRDRIESAGGTVEVASAVGEGTTVTLRVPLG